MRPARPLPTPLAPAADEIRGVTRSIVAGADSTRTVLLVLLAPPFYRAEPLQRSFFAGTHPTLAGGVLQEEPRCVLAPTPTVGCSQKKFLQPGGFARKFRLGSENYLCTENIGHGAALGSAFHHSRRMRDDGNCSSLNWSGRGQEECLRSDPGVEGWARPGKLARRC